MLTRNLLPEPMTLSGSASPLEVKRALRKSFASLRRKLSDREPRQAALSEALILFAEREIQSPESIVAVFAALPDEADPQPLSEHLTARGIVTAYPRIDGKNLVFAEATLPDLVPGRMGIHEPSPSAREVPLGAIDIFIVPGLVFTRNGDRLGYGGGFYDRTLSQWRAARNSDCALAIGVGFDIQVVDTLPVEPHDQRLDGLITDAGWHPVSQPSG